MDFSTFPLLFLQASISAVLTCSAASITLRIARRRWPALDTHRAPWLLAQLAGAITLILVLLPTSAQLGVLADVAVPVAVAAPWHASGEQGAAFLDEAPYDLVGSDLPGAAAWLWLAVYGAGVAWHALRWARAHGGLAALLRAADSLTGSGLASHPAFALAPGALPPVLELDAPVSPMLAGLVHPVLLLPRHLRSLAPVQQQLIVAHELMHLRRRDHVWQHAGLLFGVGLWFVPSVHSLYRRLQWAIETGCDRAVLAGRSPFERRSYAAALVAQMTLQVRADAALTFGAQPVAGRIRLIRAADAVAPAGPARVAMMLIVAALCATSVLLQPRFVLEAAALPQTMPSLVVTRFAAPWQAPLRAMHVSSPFGPRNDPGRMPHGGVDLRARRGTAVMAPAAGTVAISTDRYAGGDRYGKVVAIDHADGTRSLYAHLDTRLVQAGDLVRAGQQIALSGATGKVTGPHLHFEVSRNGANVDPLSLLQPHRP